MPSLWAKFRMGKTAADEALAKHAGTEAEPKLAPAAAKYRHIPKHAQTDAIIGAPGCYKEIDRQTIKRQSRRRSQMPINYGSYRKDSFYGRCTSPGEPGSSSSAVSYSKPDSRLSKRVDSGFASGAHSLHSHEGASGSSSQEDLPTMKGKQRASSGGGAGMDRSAMAGRRAPRTIRIDNVGVCEMLHDNPNRKLGQAPRLSSPPSPSSPARAASRQKASETVSPAVVGGAAKAKRSWLFGRKAATASA